MRNIALASQFHELNSSQTQIVSRFGCGNPTLLKASQNRGLNGIVTKMPQGAFVPRVYRLQRTSRISASARSIVPVLSKPYDNRSWRRPNPAKSPRAATQYSPGR
jgi:hypothetical protein